MGAQLKIVILLLCTVTQTVYGWGFLAHKTINRQAVYLLPNNSLFAFFKTNIDYLSENAVNADKRRYTQENEACRHYIDLDSYSKIDSAKLPKYFSDAKTKFSEDTLKRHGILPWQIAIVQKNLTKAMFEKDGNGILQLAADLGHYIGDSNVPLHTTHNYDGQYTNQKGIHALWETRIPELQLSNYDFLIGKASFVKDVQAMAWISVQSANKAVDSVFSNEKYLSNKLSEQSKYSFTETNYGTIKTYSEMFTIQYSELLEGQVERQLRNSIKMVADCWYTSWIEAGQPDLSTLGKKFEKEDSPVDKNLKNDRFLESHHNCNHKEERFITKTLLTKTN